MSKKKLPARLSTMLGLALDDLIEVERMKKTYCVNMGVWHRPTTDGRCEVCLGGAVLARSLGVSPHTPVSGFLRSHLGVPNAGKVEAMDWLRVGTIAAAISAFYGEYGAGLSTDACRKLSAKVQTVFGPHPYAYVPAYEDNPGAFKRALRRVQKKLASVGL